jgi:hypothetical protein
MNDNQEKFAINVNVGSRPYNITINREDEAIYREAVKMLNRKIRQYSATWQADKDDYMAMVMLDMAVNLIKEEDVDKRLKDLSTKIDSTLDK